MQLVVKTSERLDEHVDTLVAVLVPTCGEEVERVFQIEIVVSVEVALDELVDLGFGDGVKVLELVHGRELDHVETVGEHAVRLAFEEMLGLVGGDVADRGEDVGTVSSGTLDAVSVVDATLARLVVDIKVLEVVVEVDAAGAKVSTQKGGVCGEDGGDVDVTLPAPDKCCAELLTRDPVAEGQVLHVILEVTDSGTPSLTSYRRVVIQATNKDLKGGQGGGEAIGDVMAELLKDLQ